MNDMTKEDRLLYTVEYICVCLIVFSYISSRYLCGVAAIIGLIYILFEKRPDFIIAFILFVFPFSGIFTVSNGSTSLFIVFRIACVIRLIGSRRLPRKVVLSLIPFLSYCVLSMVIEDTNALVRIVNLCLWFLMGYFIVEYSDLKCSKYFARGIIQGTIISCIVRVFVNKIPLLYQSLVLKSFFDEQSRQQLSRFSGLWNDPNSFTAFIFVALVCCYVALNHEQFSIVEYISYSLILTAFGVLTLSKSCILVMIVFWMYIFIKKSQLKAKYKVAIILMGIVSLMFAFKYVILIIEVIVRRFTSSTSVEKLTTGRSEIWKMYISDMNIKEWLLGRGINTPILNGTAAHNTIIQVIFNIGLLGLILWAYVWYCQYRLSNKENKEYSRVYVPIWGLFCIMFFLDGMFLELFYIFMPLLFSISFFQKSEKVRIENE